MCCHLNHHRCCLTPASSLTWGSEDSMCPLSPAAKPQLLPLHLWRGSSMHLPQNIAFWNAGHTVLSVLFQFPFPFLIPCLCLPLTHSHLHPRTGLQRSLHCPGVSASGSELLPWSKSAKCIWGVGLKRWNRASLALPWSVVVWVPDWYPWVYESSLQANSLN